MSGLDALFLGNLWKDSFLAKGNNISMEFLSSSSSEISFSGQSDVASVGRLLFRLSGLPDVDEESYRIPEAPTACLPEGLAIATGFNAVELVSVETFGK